LDVESIKSSESNLEFVDEDSSKNSFAPHNCENVHQQNLHYSDYIVESTNSDLSICLALPVMIYKIEEMTSVRTSVKQTSGFIYEIV